MNRVHDRADFTSDTRLTLLEGDIDTIEKTMKEMLKTAQSSNRVLVGILISIATTGIVVALTAVLTRAGG